MQAFLASLPYILEIILYILKSRSQTKTEVIQGIWARRKEARDDAIINNKNDMVSMDTADIVSGLDGMPKKDSNDTGK